MVRALIGFVEFFFPLLPGGVVPIVVGLISPRSKRLGDMAAGTFAINERVSLRPPPALAMPPHLGAWAVRADIAAIPPSLAIAVRQFLGRASRLTPPVRDRVGRELYAAVMRHVSPPPPPTHHEWVLVAVLVDRRRRDAERLAREDARRARVLPVDRLAERPDVPPGGLPPPRPGRRLQGGTGPLAEGARGGDRHDLPG